MQKIIINLKVLLCKMFESPSFIIKIENGSAIKVKGLVKSSFMSDCIDIIDRNELKSGLIYAVMGQYGKSVLKVSGEIPKDARQQFRNTWNVNA
jgi:Protein of unknown function (DUF3634)